MIRTSTGRAGLTLAILSVAGMSAALAAGPPAHMRGPMRGMTDRTASAGPMEKPEAFERYGCGACHRVDQRGVGPALAWVAWRRPGRGPRAVNRLAAFIEHGGQGRWGDTPMPDLNVAPEDADTLARWILSLPPKAPPSAATTDR